ncbi:tetratricopeptide [Cladorrhinum sp. PSN332]|nr:tetratricopeptide [Cladorrhinum sp. PSN332]
MASTGEPSTSEDARRHGNELYKKGDLSGAETSYKLAAKLAPNDATPLSNLSSVKFEQGQYSAAAAYIHKALELSKDLPLDKAAERKREVLHLRLAKCYLHECRFAEAEQAARQVSDQQFTASVQSTLGVLNAWRTCESSNDETVHWRNVLDRLPRYKTPLDDVAEYYAIGHDTAESLADKELLDPSSAQDSLSLMFCGSGDARHLFKTFLALNFSELESKKKKFKDVHFTVLDLKPASIARTLLFLEMFGTYQMLKLQKVPGCEDAPKIMAYVYATSTIPAAVNAKIQQHIETLITGLESEDESLFEWLFVDPATRKKVVYVLKQWQIPLADQASYFRTKTVRRVVRERLRGQGNVSFGPLPKEPPPKGMETDREVFDELAVLLPDRDFAERRDPELVPLMMAYEKNARNAAKALGDYIDENWVTNPTLVDIDFTRASAREFVMDEDKIPHLDEDLLKVVTDLTEATGKSALHSLGTFFDVVSMSVLVLSKRIRVEVLVGEMSEVMERIRRNCLDSRSRPCGGIDPSEFPKTYDRIHMSNIPDYIGGPLGAALFGRPLLREDKVSNLRFTVLLNPPMFSDHEHFQSEYFLMYKDERLTDHFALKRRPRNDMNDLSGPLAAMMKMMSGGAGDFMSEGYIVWDQVPTQKLLPQKGLLSRQALEKWLYALFLKLCLPYPRPRISQAPVHSPLNLTAFLRLVAHLSSIGYPSHWLSGVLEALCGGKITTTARAPRHVSTSKADVDAAHPAAKMTVAPWRADFTTALGVWSRLLPFGFVAPPAPPASIAGPGDVGEYSVSFPSFDDSSLRVLHFVLVFWDSTKGGPPARHGMRRLLLDDETGDRSELGAEKRKSAVHVFSSFHYETKSRTARWWCRMDVMKSLTGVDSSWKVYIWRTDTWERVTAGVDAKTGVSFLGPWTRT